MINFGKRILGTMGLLFLMLGSTYCFAGAGCEGGNLIGSVCDCPPLTKYVEGKCASCAEKGVCCGSKLNTNVPFIGKCVEFDMPCDKDGGCYGSSSYTCKNSVCRANSTSSDEMRISQGDAFPILMGGLTRLMLTIIILTGFIIILAGGVMIAAAGSDDGKAKNGKKMIMSVVIAFAILGASGVILRLINPNFFK